MTEQGSPQNRVKATIDVKDPMFLFNLSNQLTEMCNSIRKLSDESVRNNFEDAKVNTSGILLKSNVEIEVRRIGSVDSASSDNGVLSLHRESTTATGRQAGYGASIYFSADFDGSPNAQYPNVLAYISGQWAKANSANNGPTRIDFGVQDSGGSSAGSYFTISAFDRAARVREIANGLLITDRTGGGDSTVVDSDGGAIVGCWSIYSNGTRLKARRNGGIPFIFAGDPFESNITQGSHLDYTASAGPGASLIQYTRVWMREGVIITSMRYFLNSGGSAARSVRMGIYTQASPTSVTGAPVTKAAETASVATGTVGSGVFHTISLTATYAVPTTGYYWLAIIADSNVLRFAYTSSASLAGFAERREQAGAGTTLPATVGAIINPASSASYVAAII